jgi:hypothetical protein
MPKMYPARRETIVTWLIYAAFLAAGIAGWVVGLTLAPRAITIAAAFGIVAICMIWRRAARVIPLGGEK